MSLHPSSRFLWVLGLLPPLCLLLGCLALRRPETRLQAPGGGRRLSDARGQEIQLGAVSQGTALLFPPTMGEYFEVTQAPESVVAVTTISPGLLHHSLLSTCLERLPRLADDHSFPTPHAVNIEAMLHLEPGAIVMASFLAAPVERVGLPVVGVMSPAMEPLLMKNARLFAQLAGQPQRVMPLARQFQGALSEIEVLAAGVAGLPAPRVLELSLSADGALRATGRRGLSQRLFARAGIENVVTAELAQVRLSPEQLLDLDPDFIVLSVYSSLTPEEFISEPAWHGLRACRARRVYRQPEGAILSVVGLVETPLYQRWLFELSRPELSQGTLRQRLREAYRLALGFELTDAQLDRALSVSANGGMAHYADLCGVAKEAGS